MNIDSAVSLHKTKAALFARLAHHYSLLQRHHADFLLHFRSVDHDDGVPRTAVEEGAVRAFAGALLAADAEDGIDLYASERRMILVRHPEHAVFDGAIFHAGGRAGAARAALGDNGQLFRLLLARRREALGAGLVLQLVGDETGVTAGNDRISSHRP